MQVNWGPSFPAQSTYDPSDDPCNDAQESVAASGDPTYEEPPYSEEGGETPIQLMSHAVIDMGQAMSLETGGAGDAPGYGQWNREQVTPLNGQGDSDQYGQYPVEAPNGGLESEVASLQQEVTQLQQDLQSGPYGGVPGQSAFNVSESNALGEGTSINLGFSNLQSHEPQQFNAFYNSQMSEPLP